MIGFDRSQLVVDGAPYLIVGGELHNSSASTAAAIETSFSATARFGVNTILAPVAWEQFEPIEGTFDTSLVDAMLAAARRLGVRLVLLWFGSWKNGMSTYAPSWVKLDSDRFPRAETSGGPVEVVSPFSMKARDADAAAFTVLMAHLAEVDGEHTVLMIQVENEVGLLGDARDRSPLADHAWSGSVPGAVIDAVASVPTMPAHEVWLAAGSRRHGSWAEVFGDNRTAGELFMAAAYATYIEHVAAAGRTVNDLPLFANAWLAVPSASAAMLDAIVDRQRQAGVEIDEAAVAAAKAAFAVEGGEGPGAYPSGGPVARVAPIWRALAPTLDLLAPDIYTLDAEPILTEHAEASGRLFVPECRRDADGIHVIMSAIGRHAAIGCCPFGIDSLTVDDPWYEHVVDAFTQLRAVAQAVRAYGSSPVGMVLDAAHPQAEVTLGGWTVAVDARQPWGEPPYPSHLLIVPLSEDEFLFVGRGVTPTIRSTTGCPVGLLCVEELDADGSVRRRLNGDETSSGKRLRFPSVGEQAPTPSLTPSTVPSTGIQRVKLYTYGCAARS